MACFSFGTISRRGLTGASACYDMLYAFCQTSMAFPWHASTYKPTWIQTHTCTHTPRRKFIHQTSFVDKFAWHTRTQTNTKPHKTCMTWRQSFTSTITLVIQSLLLYRAPCVHEVLLPRRCTAKQARLETLRIKMKGKIKCHASGHLESRPFFFFNKFEAWHKYQNLHRNIEWRLVTSATGRVRSCLLHYAQVCIDALILKSMATCVQYVIKPVIWHDS